MLLKSTENLFQVLQVFCRGAASDGCLLSNILQMVSLVVHVEKKDATPKSNLQHSYNLVGIDSHQLSRLVIQQYLLVCCGEVELTEHLASSETGQMV